MNSAETAEGRRGREQGFSTVATVILALALAVCAGIVADVNQKLRAGHEAAAVAQAAARAGGGQIDRAALYRSGRIRVDPGAATRAARAYLRTTGHTGTVSVASARTIQVTVTVTKPTALLSLIGIPTVQATATATADLVPGVEGPQR